jgi:hypothetical protein
MVGREDFQGCAIWQIRAAHDPFKKRKKLKGNTARQRKEHD